MIAIVLSCYGLIGNSCLVFDSQELFQNNQFRIIHKKLKEALINSKAN